jgi:EAL domain-containing protein (putative c-di-GMP-specific phosphodiesterase class I)
LARVVPAHQRLELEITEGVLIGDFERAVSILRRLKMLGVRIAMDDFGTGYSSLSYLQAFPFDKIKIDQSFISNVRSNAQSAAIVCAVIGLARGLQLRCSPRVSKRRTSWSSSRKRPATKYKAISSVARSRSTITPK